MSSAAQARPHAAPESPVPLPPRQRLHEIVEHAAHLLPAQGPIGIFVHHNTLHAFEDLPFEQAVVRAAELFGCEPYLSEDRYHDELARGRITDHDLAEVVRADLGASAWDRIAGLTTRGELRLALLRHRIASPELAEQRWLIAERDLIARFQPETSADARRHVVEGARRSLERVQPSPREERAALEALWQACLRVTARFVPEPRPAPVPVRHRDLLLELTGEDPDALVHPLIIRLCAAFLDQGLAYWTMPRRDEGLMKAARLQYGRPVRFAPWTKGLAAILADEERRALDAEASVLESLEALGVEEPDWERFIQKSLLALRGWAGMIRQVETRPDRVPSHAPPASLMEWLAVRLAADRAALAHLARTTGIWDGPLSGLRQALLERRPAPLTPTAEQWAFFLFQTAQALGLPAADIDGLTERNARELLTELARIDPLERRRLLHLAYERRYRVEVLDALQAHAAATAGEPAGAAPRCQVITCIDEREESFRRALEEIWPECETFSAAGFFGVAMYYRGAEDARPVPLCPVVIRPQHEVEETVDAERKAEARRRARMRQVVGRLRYSLGTASRSLTTGAVVTAVGGAAAAFPLVLRVLFPRSAARLAGSVEGLIRAPKSTHLELDYRPEVRPAVGARAGFQVEEMAAIVRRLLEETGMAGRLAPLVVVIGHGSSSLNNPHESAHDCGACGGGRGGPNARAFARMANDPRVRRCLAESGLTIPSTTWFLGAYHNTCDDSITAYDLDDVPEERAADVEQALAALDRARAANAHERCRRFVNAPIDLTPAEALAHVEARAEDLAQPRPEYGHATNACLMVGRRHRTRGLFLDRRAFLTSYDQFADDAEGSLLARVLAAVVPVCAGINLEYYFSYVDPSGYGCQTKLPHNIVGLLGVMDGHQSDLRPGLPWQMVEIHEPVRLLCVVEAELDLLMKVVTANSAIRRLVENRWIQLGALSPWSAAVHLYDVRARSFYPYRPESHELPVVSSSVQWYQGRREHLRCARVVGRTAAATAAAASSEELDSAA